MLAGSTVDPFADTRAKSYKSHADIDSTCQLLDAYDRSDIGAFERVLERNGASLRDDAFVRGYVDDLRTNIRLQVLVGLLKPYRAVRLASLGRQLHVSAAEVERLVVVLLLNRSIAGAIDQVDGVLTLDAPPTDVDRQVKALGDWARRVRHTTSVVEAAVSNASTVAGSAGVIDDDYRAGGGGGAFPGMRTGRRRGAKAR